MKTSLTNLLSSTTTATGVFLSGVGSYNNNNN